MDVLASLPYFLVNLLVLLSGVAIPGYLLSRRLVHSSGPLESAVFAAALSISVTPTLVFLAMLALGQPLSMGLVLAVALLVVIACRPWQLGRVRAPTRDELLLLGAVVVASFVFLQLTNLQNQHPYGFFGACIRYAMLKHTLQDASGWSIYNAELGDYITHVFRSPTDHMPALDGMLEDVRPANSVLLGSFVVLVGAAGDEVLSLVVYFIILGGSTILAGQWLRRAWAAMLVAIISVAGIHELLAYMQNENAYGLAMGVALLALLVGRRMRRAEGVAAGILLGFATGLRLPALIWVVPVGLMLARAPRGQIATVFGSFLVSWAPWAILFWVARGDPFYIAMDPYGVETELLGGAVLTRPLNWPLYETLVRIPQDDLPALFYVPVRFLQSTGAIVASAMLVGFFGSRPRLNLPFPRWTWAAWAAPLTALLLVHVYADDEKASYLALAMAPAPALLACFVRMVAAPRRRVATLVSWLLLTIALAFLPRMLVDIEVPIDPRASRYVVRSAQFDDPSEEDRSPETRKRRLGRLAFLPDLSGADNRNVHSSSLLEHLAHPPTGPRFESGRIHVLVSDVEGLREARFPVKASLEEPRLPGFRSEPPEDIEDIASMPRFIVHLRVETSPEPTVVIDSRPERLRLTIDPGPPPHEPRFISFRLDESIYADIEYTPGADEDLPVGRRPEFEVEGGGTATPALGLGYRIQMGEQVLDYISIITNLELPRLSTARSELPCDAGSCEYWVSYYDGRSALSGRPPSSTSQPGGVPPWPSRQLLQIRHPYR